MKNLYFLILVISVLIITSCSSFKVDIKGKTAEVKKLKNLAVINVYICPPRVPTFPLIDAGIYKGSFNDIYDDIALLHSKYADTVVNYFGAQLEKYTKSKILYGENLYSILTPEAIKKNDIKSYSLILDNEDFPKIPIHKNALSFFDFSKESSPANFFTTNNIKKEKLQIGKICELLDVDGIIIVYFSVSTTDIGIFGINGDRCLEEKVLYFDRSGSHLCSGIINSKEKTGSPDDLVNYESVFLEYFKFTDLFMRKLYLGEEPKE